MGTRADFYVGKGKDAEWLGSVAWDGYEWEEKPNCKLMTATTENEYRKAVKAIAKKREDWTAPEHGWPWPWEDSNTTDYAYAFHEGKVHIFHYRLPIYSQPSLPSEGHTTRGERTITPEKSGEEVRQDGNPKN